MEKVTLCTRSVVLPCIPHQILNAHLFVNATQTHQNVSLGPKNIRWWGEWKLSALPINLQQLTGRRLQGKRRAPLQLRSPNCGQPQQSTFLGLSCSSVYAAFRNGLSPAGAEKNAAAQGPPIKAPETHYGAEAGNDACRRMPAGNGNPPGVRASNNPCSFFFEKARPLFLEGAPPPQPQG